ncbi:cation channel sperm-associated auxiliary subunit beta-like [Petaurus breviceps papuanus]|uniref:cation channel sperm-associated auxiliary subunit beta-like n=1 Tax=Petaurus breviceps papuanus TaxID=3040969 RepID=UPI0036DC1D9F
MLKPILQWQLGTPTDINDIRKVANNVFGVKITRSPCANDVAIIGLQTDNTVSGFYLGLTYSGFWHDRGTEWYDITSKVCLFDEDEACQKSSLVDMILTNHFLVILTTTGLFISTDLCQPNSSLLFTRVDFCGFSTEDYTKAKLWYNERCLANQEDFEDDYLAITFEKSRTMSQADTCFFSTVPFKQWVSCMPKVRRNKRFRAKLVSFLIDEEMNSAIYLYSRKENSFTLVRKLKNKYPLVTLRNPLFVFPEDFHTVVGMVFHPRTHFLYVFGNQIWISYDGANSFEIIGNFSDVIVLSCHSVRNSEIVFLSKESHVYISKAGEAFTYNNGNMGQIPMGSASITKILYHDHLVGFPSSALADLLSPFVIVSIETHPCLKSDISIHEHGDSLYRIDLHPGHVDSLFIDSETDMTVVIPGYSSFLILKILNDKSALAIATMPRLVPVNKTILNNKWFLYNFVNEEWSITCSYCKHMIIHNDVNPSTQITKYLDVGSVFKFKMKVVPTELPDSWLYRKPMIKMITGNVFFLDIETKAYSDGTDNYIVDVFILNRYFRKGATTISFIVWEASVECKTSIIIITVKSSCSYSKSISYTPKYELSWDQWEEGYFYDETGFNLIKTLPYNYRPPSPMGIAIPTTDNIYHADPSKDRERNYHPESKKTGIYKQCFNKTSREECNCTIEQKMSGDIATSDCTEKVLRFMYPLNQYPISLAIKLGDSSTPMEGPYLVTISELNNRTHWKLKQVITKKFTRMKLYIERGLSHTVYNPKDLNLSIMGSELYHFRVKVIPGVTFCELSTEFQIYVDKAPLAFPGRILISAITAVILGGIILAVFMIELFDVHLWLTLKNLVLRKNKVSASLPSLDTEA